MRAVWTELPITDIAIACVEALAKADGCPLIQEDRLVIERRPDQAFDEDKYDADYKPTEEDDAILNFDGFDEKEAAPNKEESKGSDNSENENADSKESPWRMNHPRRTTQIQSKCLS